MKKIMKKKTAGVVAALLAGSMVVAMTGCGSSSEPAGTQQAAGDQKASEDGEYTKIVYAFKSFNNIPEDLSDVNEAINKITREKIGVEVELMPIASSSYGQQVSLAMQGGEQIDLFHTGSGLELSTCRANHQLYDITDIVNEHAPGAVAAVGDDFMKTEMVDGRIYGIPADKGIALAPTLLYREDILEEIGIDPSDIQNITDLTDVYEKVKAAYPDMSPLVPVNPGDSGMINTIYGFDYLGDRYIMPTGVLRGDELKVENFYETDEFKNILSLARDWYNKGYIMGDAATTTSTSIELLSAGKGFSYISNYGGNDAGAQISTQTGQKIGALRLSQPYLGTSDVNRISWAVASTCKNPEKALEFLDLTYTDKDVINLIIYGIEGTDYVKVSDNVVKYPDGLDASTVPYTAQLSCGVCGSQFNQYILDGASEDTQKVMKEDNQKSGRSKAFGFTFDNSTVKTQYTAVNNVINQYLPGLRCGSLDPETELPKFQQSLKDAGIDEIIAEKQKQLDAWSAANAG